MHPGLYRKSHQPRKDQMRTYKNSVTFMHTINCQKCDMSEIRVCQTSTKSISFRLPVEKGQV